MARRSYSLTDALHYVMGSESEDGEKCSALEEETSSAQDEDTSSPEDEGTPSSEDDSNTTDEEYQPVPDSSSSGEEDDTDTAVEAEQLMAETEELAGAWMSRHRKIMWFPTPEETLHYNPVSTGITPGPTLYAAARISNLRSAFDLFITEEIIQLLCTHTNMHGRRRFEDWRDVDEVEMRAYIGILILAGVYRSRHEATRGMWDAKTGRAMFRATMPLYRYTRPCPPHSAAAAAIVTGIQEGESECDPEPANKSRRRCELCTQRRRRTATTCSNCGKCVRKDHSAVVCTSCCP